MKGIDLGEVSLHHNQSFTEPAQPFTALGTSPGVTVDTQQLSRFKRPEDLFGVTAVPKCGINVVAVRPDLKKS